MSDTATAPEGLEPAVRRLIDIEAIRDLTAKITWATDTMDRAAAWSHWADQEDIVFDLSALGGKLQRFEGRDAVRKFYEGSDNPWLTWHPAYELHLIANHIIDVDGDRATCRYASLGYLRNAEGKPFLNGIQYDYEFVRTSDGWRVVSRSQNWVVPPEDRMEHCPPPTPTGLESV